MHIALWWMSRLAPPTVCITPLLAGLQQTFDLVVFDLQQFKIFGVLAVLNFPGVIREVLSCPLERALAVCLDLMLWNKQNSSDFSLACTCWIWCHGISFDGTLLGDFQFRIGAVYFSEQLRTHHSEIGVIRNQYSCLKSVGSILRYPPLPRIGCGEGA